jgi:hypothetical protein
MYPPRAWKLRVVWGSGSVMILKCSNQNGPPINRPFLSVWEVARAGKTRTMHRTALSAMGATHSSCTKVPHSWGCLLDRVMGVVNKGVLLALGSCRWRLVSSYAVALLVVALLFPELLQGGFSLSFETSASTSSLWMNTECALMNEECPVRQGWLWATCSRPFPQPGLENVLPILCFHC